MLDSITGFSLDDWLSFAMFLFTIGSGVYFCTIYFTNMKILTDKLRSRGKLVGWRKKKGEKKDQWDERQTEFKHTESRLTWKIKFKVTFFSALASNQLAICFTGVIELFTGTFDMMEWALLTLFFWSFFMTDLFSSEAGLINRTLHVLFLVILSVMLLTLFLGGGGLRIWIF